MTRVFRNITLVLTIALVLSATGGNIHAAGGFMSAFIDTTDGYFDMSDWLDHAYGFMPIVSLITEPAVGYGVSGGLLFIHRDKESRGKPLTTAPSMSAVGGMYTENGSWGLFAYHEGHWKHDSIRYQGGGGYMSMNLTYYPPILQDLIGGLTFNIEGFGLLQRIEFRLAGSPWFLGADYIYFKNDVAFDALGIIPDVETWEFDSAIGGLGGLAIYDSRDNIFTPNHGIRSQTHYTLYDEIFGSDKQFHRFDLYWLGYYNYHDKLVFGLRLDSRFTDGETPFYSLPFVQLRGIPAMRYQGEYVLLAETEERWTLHPRWGLVGFAGIARAVPKRQTWDDAETVWNAGGGFRYLMARMYGLWAGIDVARGPEEWAFYIQVGHDWGRL